jgi:hypothetical protein
MKGEASGFASHHPLYLIFHHRYVILIFYAMVKSDGPAIGFWVFLFSVTSISTVIVSPRKISNIA